MKQLSPAALQALYALIPYDRYCAAWADAYDVYLRRAPTTDGTAQSYAADRADRFWPLYMEPDLRKA